MNLRKKFLGQFTVVAMLVIFVVFTLANSFVIQFSKVKQYKKEIITLNKQIENTQSQIKYLKNIQGYTFNGDLESVAREKLNMVKFNEIVFIDVSREGN
ncbi:FtsB family cell division protein [Romboutsia sp.]|uniref:FtsB family cell division protein n=1 Tax=Romboutsia sp. TaxID=1965302 RepID=UPI003F3F97DA